MLARRRTSARRPTPAHLDRSVAAADAALSRSATRIDAIASPSIADTSRFGSARPIPDSHAERTRWPARRRRRMRVKEIVLKASQFSYTTVAVARPWSCGSRSTRSQSPGVARQMRCGRVPALRRSRGRVTEGSYSRGKPRPMTPGFLRALTKRYRRRFGRIVVEDARVG